MLPRCGRVAHVCEANSILQSVFPAAIAFFETVKFAIRLFLWNKLKIRTRQRGNCSTLAGKSRGGTPFCRTLKIVLPKSRIFCKVFLIATVPPEQLQDICLLLQGNKAGRSCSPRLEKLSLFSPPSPCAKSMARRISLPAGSDQGYSPWIPPAFLKNCWIKKLLFACGSEFATPFLEKPTESGSARLGHIPSLPWESQLPLKLCSIIIAFWFLKAIAILSICS